MAIGRLASTILQSLPSIAERRLSERVLLGRWRSVRCVVSRRDIASGPTNMFLTRMPVRVTVGCCILESNLLPTVRRPRATAGGRRRSIDLDRRPDVIFDSLAYAISLSQRSRLGEKVCILCRTLCRTHGMIYNLRWILPLAIHSSMLGVIRCVRRIRSMFAFCGCVRWILLLNSCHIVWVIFGLDVRNIIQSRNHRNARLLLRRGA